ncbi:hypothetical protein [Piscinibacter sakaiensis]|uniref:hypothetical protein n=1 Tax=Piscinibacter sakaiensis TaxID=1547922 RepID=UPI003AAF2F61
MRLSSIHPDAPPCGSLFRRGRVFASLAVALGCAVGAAHAADKPADKPASKPAASKRASPPPAEPVPAPKPLTPLLTRDELRACMTLQASNKQNAADVQRMQPEIVAEKAELQRSGETMKAELAALDRSSEEAVNGYNARAAARDRQIADLEAKISEFNAKLTAFETGRADYARNCDNRRYDERDEKALLGQ